MIVTFSSLSNDDGLISGMLRSSALVLLLIVCDEVLVRVTFWNNGEYLLMRTIRKLHMHNSFYIHVGQRSVSIDSENQSTKQKL